MRLFTALDFDHGYFGHWATAAIECGDIVLVWWPHFLESGYMVGAVAFEDLDL